MELRDRLERVLGRTEGYSLGGDHAPLEEALSGAVLETEHGACYCVDTEYAMEHRYGGHTLRSAFDIDREGICVAGKDEALSSFEISRCVFLDTETTGLAGGSGTYAFLVGLGFFAGNKFLVRQLFMRDYDEEEALLSVVAESLAGREFVVTYNGKTFDVPLIRDRLVMCRMAPILSAVNQLDLLHAARRIWGRRLSDCRLVTVERSVLGVDRGEDIPSEDIPLVYFDFLRSGDASGLAAVFRHNRSDVLLLPILLKEICGAVRDVGYRGLEPVDLLSIGKVYDSMKRRDKTLPFYAEALRGLQGEDRTVAACRLGMAYKRLKMWDKAVSTWEGILGRDAYEPYEELAKYYEHRSRELERARKVVALALKTFAGSRHETGLLRRLKRIERKLRGGGKA
jgi:uncharacterized protein YprB with RNaseH-like and TPR domain